MELSRDLKAIFDHEWDQIIKTQPTMSTQRDKLEQWLKDNFVATPLDFAIICATQTEVANQIVTPSAITNILGLRVCCTKIWLQCKSLQTKETDNASGKASERDDELVASPIRDGKMAKFQK